MHLSAVFLFVKCEESKSPGRHLYVLSGEKKMKDLNFTVVSDSETDSVILATHWQEIENLFYAFCNTCYFSKIIYRGFRINDKNPYHCEIHFHFIVCVTYT